MAFLVCLAQSLKGSDPIDWRRLQDPVSGRELIGPTVPGYGPITVIDADRREFEVAGRLFQEPRFPTAGGRARLAVTPLPDAAHCCGLAAGEKGVVLSLITARSPGRHNSVVYRTAGRQRGMPHRQTNLMHPQDLIASGLKAHQRVTLQGEPGALVDIGIIPGSV
ncbi:MAG: molybdopterin dinucleotide binding domain-containing protein, partial [Cyanobium sp.]